MPVRIGITCDHETITDRRGTPSPRLFVPESYVTAVRAAGGQPWILPTQPPIEAAAVLDSLDALVITGGDFDVPPDYYNDAPRPALGKINRPRSDFERALIDNAAGRGIPLLGVCGGMQLLNVVFGGTLYQDLRERPKTQNHVQAFDKRQPHHRIDVTSGTHLSRLCGDALEVNSTHHQLVRDLGRDVLAAALAPDGVIEAIEVQSSPFMLGVQWHPEAMGTPEQLAIYRGLVQAAREARR